MLTAAKKRPVAKKPVSKKRTGTAAKTTLAKKRPDTAAKTTLAKKVTAGAKKPTAGKASALKVVTKKSATKHAPAAATAVKARAAVEANIGKTTPLKKFLEAAGWYD
jgi:DNA-binding protein HU-beta